MLSYTTKILEDCEKDQSIESRDAAFAALREVGLDDFGEVLLHMPHGDFPKMSSLLPKMSPADVQNLWTGKNGYELLRQTCTFVRSLAYNYNLITGKPVNKATVFDYGCGYGRIARLMYYFVDDDNLYGVDPWIRSIEECDAAGMGANFIQSDYLPVTLPVGDRKFDLAYAFSVFTHLSRRAALMALSAVRRIMAPGGVFCITIRPPEYWDLDASAAPFEERWRLKHIQMRDGFAFFPHDFPPVDGEVTYGDAGIMIDWLSSEANGWSVARIDRSLEDPYQVLVFLKAE